MSICIYDVLYFILLFILTTFICVSDNNMSIVYFGHYTGSYVICYVMFMSFSSNTTGVTSGAGTAYTSSAFPGLVGFVLLNLKFYA